MDSSGPTLSLTAENVGGFEETQIQLNDGITVLEGNNATNGTSFLQAVVASMGSDQFTFKGDAHEGRVELAFGETVVGRRFERRNGTVAAVDVDQDVVQNVSPRRRSFSFPVR